MIIDQNTIDAKRLGRNIRSLRVYFGETQEELALTLKTNYQNISYWETGARVPKNEWILAIAQHYLVSEDILVYADFSDLETLHPSQNSSWRGIDNLFPFSISVNAIQDSDFLKAAHADLKMRLQLNERSPYNTNVSELVEACFACYDDYQNALRDESSKYEAAANLVSLLFLFLTSVKLMTLMPKIEELDLQEGPALFIRLWKNNDQFKRAITRASDALSYITQPEAKEYMAEKYHECIELITLLKENQKWYAIGDFFLALQYYLGIVENSLDYLQNVRIGFEMLRMLESINNKYAACLINYYLNETADGGSQIVKDNA